MSRQIARVLLVALGAIGGLDCARPCAVELRSGELPATSPGGAIGPRGGVVSYWALWKDGAERWFSAIDGGAIAIVNPESGALDGSALAGDVVRPTAALTQAMKVAVWNPNRRSKILAYVPTGYFCQPGSKRSDCGPARERGFRHVKDHIDAYLEAEGQCGQQNCRKIDGFFFDEVNPGGAENPSFDLELGRLRDLATREGRAFVLAFNVGAPRTEALAAARKGEIIVTLEQRRGAVTEALWEEVTRLNADLARKEIGSWVMLYDVSCDNRLTQWERLSRSGPTPPPSSQGRGGAGQGTPGAAPLASTSGP